MGPSATLRLPCHGSGDAAKAFKNWLRGETESAGSNTTIVIADDHPLFRGALRQAIASVMPKARVIEASGIGRAERRSQERDVDLILLDLTMPGVQGFSGLISCALSIPTCRS